MADNGTTVLVNSPKIQKLLTSDLAKKGDAVGKILKKGNRRLASIDKLPGCKCKRGPQRKHTYNEVVTQLRSLTSEELAPVKAFFKATTLNLGAGYQI